MLRLPACFASAILSLVLGVAPLFFKRIWRRAEMRLVGAILAPGKRTVTSILRLCGRCQAGMAKASASSTSIQTPPHGAMQDCRSC